MTRSDPAPPAQDTPQNTLPSNLNDNIEAMARLHQQALEEESLLHRPVERLFRSLARPLTLYWVLGVLFVWMTVNTVMHLRGHSLDAPPFFWTQGAVALLSLLTSLSVLIVQARQGEMQDRRARLELQINLLAEQKISKLIGLVEELRRDLPGVPDRHDAQAHEMQQQTDVEAVLDELKRSVNQDQQTP